MSDTLRELKALLGTRKGLGALVVTVSASVALGVVPNILQSWTSRVWLLYVAFVVGVAGVLLGWALTRDRGLGIVLAFYHTNPSGTRAAIMREAAASRHSTLLRLDRDKLWPKDDSITMTGDQVHLLGRLLDARCTELVRSGGSIADATLYPLMAVQDGYQLGRELDSLGPGLAIAHFSPPQRQVIPGIRLHSRLREPPTPELAALSARSLKPPTDPLLRRNPTVQAGEPGHHYLALIIRLANRDEMVADARYVAETGNPIRDGRATGYFFDPTNRTTPGPKCGATVVVEANGNLPEGPDEFAAIVTYIRAQWAAARAAWSAEAGSNVEGLLFFNGPLPIAIALGWSLNDHTPTFVAHDIKQT